MTVRQLQKFVSILCIWLMTSSVFAEVPSCSRIVSLAPSITEIIYSLALEEQLVGVTRYCLYPEAATQKPKIGGLFDLNFEAVLQQKPTIVFALFEHREQRAQLERLGLQVITLDHRTVSGILESINKIGDLCGKQKQANALVTNLQSRVSTIQARVAGTSKLRVLVAVGGGSRDGALRNLWISGNDGYYSEILHYLNASNVYQGVSASVPSLSAEGVLSLNPEIIVEIIPDRELTPEEEQALMKVWGNYQDLKAVREKKVFTLSGQYVSIPGPRFILLLEKLAKLLRPDQFAENHQKT